MKKKATRPVMFLGILLSVVILLFGVPTLAVAGNARMVTKVWIIYDHFGIDKILTTANKSMDAAGYDLYEVVVDISDRHVRGILIVTYIKKGLR